MDYGYRGSGTWEGTKEQDGYGRIQITSTGEIESGDYERIWRDFTLSPRKIRKVKIEYDTAEAMFYDITMVEIGHCFLYVKTRGQKKQSRGQNIEKRERSA